MCVQCQHTQNNEQKSLTRLLETNVIQTITIPTRNPLMHTFFSRPPLMHYNGDK